MHSSWLCLAVVALVAVQSSAYNFTNCVFITGDLTLDITYLKNDKSIAVQLVTVPTESSVTVTGHCPAVDPLNPTVKKSDIGLNWETYELDISFELDNEEDRWHATFVDLKYDTSTYPDADTTGSRKLTANTTKQLFSTRKNMSYGCKTAETYQLKDSVTGEDSVKWGTKDLEIIPFSGTAGVDKCSADVTVKTDPPKPITKPKTEPKTDPKKVTTAAPGPEIVGGGGKKTALGCTLLSLVFCSGVGFLVYMNRGDTPNYLRVI